MEYIIKNILKTSICVICYIYIIITLGKNQIFAFHKALSFNLCCNIFFLPLSPKFMVFQTMSALSSLNCLFRKKTFTFMLETSMPEVAILKLGYLISLDNFWHLLNYLKILFLYPIHKCRLYFQHVFMLSKI